MGKGAPEGAAFPEGTRVRLRRLLITLSGKSQSVEGALDLVSWVLGLMVSDL